MPRSKKKGVGGGNAHSGGYDNYGVEFINIYLTEADKESLRQVDLSLEDMFLELERWVENGYKVSLSIDLNNTGGVCAVTGKQGCVPDTNKGKCLVSRGPDVRGAIASTLYKLQHYCVDGHFPLGGRSPEADFG